MKLDITTKDGALLLSALAIAAKQYDADATLPKMQARLRAQYMAQAKHARELSERVELAAYGDALESN